MQKPSKRRRGAAGMAILDTLLATSVGAIVILATTALLMAANAANDAAAQDVAAYNAARQIVENLRVMKAAKFNNVSNYNATSFGPVPQLSLLNNGSATVTIADWKSGSTVKQAFITVNWRTLGSGKTTTMNRSRQLTALFSKNGVAP